MIEKYDTLVSSHHVNYRVDKIHNDIVYLVDTLVSDIFGDNEHHAYITTEELSESDRNLKVGDILVLFSELRQSSTGERIRFEYYRKKVCEQ